MRPVKLKMQAFGPYRHQETVDFSELGANRVFLIHGDTGSGKTSILDALVFALYGDTSGGERKADQMRCESAEPDLPTEVVFDFSLGEKSYRVRRRPQQKYVGARGALVDKPAEVALWERTGCGPNEEGKPLATKITEANALIKEILGFSCDQFRQVVVLPQGRFRELLAAGSEKREEILRQLFRTERFRELESTLFDRARLVRQQMEQLREQRKAQLDTVGAVDDAELAALMAEATAELDSAGERVKEAEVAAQQAGDALAAAEAADEAGRAVVAAREEVLALDARAEEIAAGQQQLETGKRAERVQPLAERLLEAATSVTDATLARGAAEQKLLAARQTEQEAVEVLAGENARLPEREAASDAVRRLEALEAAIGAWRGAGKDRAGAAERVVALRDAAENARLSAGKAGRILAGLKETAAAGDTAAAKLEGVRGRHETARQAADRCRRLLKAQAQMEEALREHDRLAAVEQQARGAHEAAQAAVLGLEARWKSGRAAALADSLEPGRPCPVCGSTEHPAPATVAGEGVSDDSLEQHRTVTEAARLGYEQAREARACAKEELTTARTIQQSILQEPGATPGLALTDAENAVAVCRAELEDLERQAEAGRLDVELAAAELAAAEALEGSKTADDARMTAERELAGKEATLVERAAGIPEELRAAGALERAFAAARTAKVKLDDAFATAQAGAAKAKELRIALEAEAKSAAAAEAKAVEQQRVCTEGFQAALIHHGFADEPAWRQCVLAESARRALEMELESYRDLVQQARGRLKQAESLLERQTEPVDVTVARTAAEEARSRHTQAISSQADARNRLAGLKGAKDRLAAIDGKSDNVRRMYETVGVLADVANGANPARVSFQRWVLGVYLDEVLVAASRRLFTMSKLRYHLQRQQESAGRGRPSGLDIAVFDGWSGSSRPAVTLSGGESFQAALALALGLAETVQEHSAGRPLETIFVDEGFGALDPDALDLAVDALMELQVSGRLVGVISHVPELKQVIPARLEVRGGSGGSSTRFVVP